MTTDEELAARDRDSLDRLRGLLHTLVAAPGETDGAALAVRQAVTATGAACGLVLRVGADGLVRPVAAVGVPPEQLGTLSGTALPPGSPSARAAVLREPVWVSSRAEREERFPETDRPAGPDGACASVPLVAGPHLLGLLLLAWDGDHHVDDREAALLTAVADLAAIELRGADAVTPAAEGAGVRDLLAALFTDAPIGFALFDPQLRFVMVNSTLAAVNGVPVEEHLGRHVKQVLPDIDDSAVAVLQRVLDTGEPLRDVEVTGRTPASPEYKIWLEDFYRVRTPSGAVLGVAAVLSDVTAQRRSERRLRQLIDSLFSFVGLCLPDGTLVEANRTALEVGGLAAEDVLGRPVWETDWFTWDPDVVRRVREAVDAARRGEVVRGDVEVRTARGNMIVDFMVAPVVEDGEVVALVPSATDVTARRRSVEQATALAALARRLSAASTVADVQDVIRVHASAAVGSRYSTVALVDADAATVSLVQPPDLPEHLVGRYHGLPIDSPVHVVRAARDGRTIVVADPVLPDHVDGDAGLAAQLQEDRRKAGVAVTVAAPLFASDGRPFGALSMGWPHVEDLDDELTARVRTVADLCGQSIERARLTDARVVAAERTGALATLAQRLASAMTPDDVTGAVAALGPAVVGAGSTRLRLLGEAALRDEALTPSGLGATDPAAPGPTTSVVLVLRDGTDQVLGTVAVDWDLPVAVDPVLRATLDTVAELVGQTLERARLHAAEHELVEGLQRRFLRPMPVVAGLDVHAVYRAAQTAVGIGGDFYDGLELPGGRLAVVVGDVAGHGMEAAADMAQLRTVLSTLLAAGIPLERLFGRAEQVLGQVASVSLATAAVAVVDLARDTLTYVHAGHPPLVLRTPDGGTRPLEGARRPLLGVSGLAGPDDAAAAPVTVPFGPGSVLVAYTDGLVESREDSLDRGIDVLAQAVSQVRADDGPGTAERVAAAVLDLCVGDRALADDVALLVLARPGG